MSIANRGITSKAVAKYMLLPGVLPWLRRFGKQLTGIFFIFTQVLGTIGLIDRSHPCLRIENRHAYSFSEILAIAWNNVRFSRQNISQILIFIAVVVSVILFFAILGAAFLQMFLSFGNAHAQYLGTPNTSIPYDINRDFAFEFLERIFGGTINTGVNFWVPGDNPDILGNVWLSGMLAGMLKVYSQALMFIASAMIIYLITMTLVDAARTGRPFGEGFDGIWAPIRFAVALGLLVPFSGAGYNGAQLLVFKTAEMGSNLATNIWHRALEGFDDCDGGDPARCNFISISEGDYGYKYLRDIFLINVCVYGYNAAIQNEGTEDNNEFMNYTNVTIDGDIEVITFGSRRAKTFCGEVTLPAKMTDAYVQPGFFSSGDSGGNGGRTSADYLPKAIADDYNRGAQLFFPYHGKMVNVASEFASESFCRHDQNLASLDCDGEACQASVKNWIELYWRQAMGRRNASGDLGDKFFEAHGSQFSAYNQWIIESVKRDAKYGWATAGVFYLRLSSAMGAVSEAIANSPRVSRMPVNFNRMYASPKHPMVLDFMGKLACGKDADGWAADFVDFCEGAPVALAVNNLLWKSADWFRTAPLEDDPNFYATLPPSLYQSDLKLQDGETPESSEPQSQLAPIPNMIYKYIRFDKNDTNPLGTIVGWGNGMFTIASWAYTASIALAILSYVPGMGLLYQILGPVLRFIGNIFVIPGFILLFVIPFLPFLYFTFAVVEWMASILEAIIGIPLWVLTWIRREGDLFGPAMSGIKMLFEIMLRPTIIVFSLLVAVIIFTAGVIFFQDALALYMGVYGGTHVQATSGVAGIGLILVLVFGLYALATSCFKMIEAIPNQFGRWMNMDGGFGAQIEMGTDNKLGPMGMAGAAVMAARTARDANRGLNQMAQTKSDEKIARDNAELLRRYNNWRNKGGSPLDADPHDNPRPPNSFSPAGFSGNSGTNNSESQGRTTTANLYDSLGVSRFASEAEIKAAFRNKSKEYHPDKVQSAWDRQAKTKWGIRTNGDIADELKQQRGLRGAQLTAETDRIYNAQFKDFTAEQMQKFKDEKAAFRARTEAAYHKRQQELQEAYETLRDAQKRARYDAQNPDSGKDKQ